MSSVNKGPTRHLLSYRNLWVSLIRWLMHCKYIFYAVNSNPFAPIGSSGNGSRPPGPACGVEPLRLGSITHVPSNSLPFFPFPSILIDFFFFYLLFSWPLVYPYTRSLISFVRLLSIRQINPWDLGVSWSLYPFLALASTNRLHPLLMSHRARFFPDAPTARDRRSGAEGVHNSSQQVLEMGD